jgi:hypothetical protein
LARGVSNRQEKRKEQTPNNAATEKRISIPSRSQRRPPAMAIRILIRWLIEIPVLRVDVNSS